MEEEYEEIPIVQCLECGAKYHYYDDYDELRNKGYAGKCDDCGSVIHYEKTYVTIPKIKTFKQMLFSGCKSPSVIIAYICIVVFLISLIDIELFAIWGGLSGENYHQPHRMITHAFLHGGFIHLMLNMLAVITFGLELENYITKKRFVILYACSMFSTWFFWLIFNHGLEIISIGASGAIFGIITAYGILFPNDKMIFILFPMRARTFLYVALALSFGLLIIGDGTKIDHVGHLSGMVGGFLYTWYLLSKDIVAVKRDKDE